MHGQRKTTTTLDRKPVSRFASTGYDIRLIPCMKGIKHIHYRNTEKAGTTLNLYSGGTWFCLSAFLSSVLIFQGMDRTALGHGLMGSFVLCGSHNKALLEQVPNSKELGNTVVLGHCIPYAP